MEKTKNTGKQIGALLVGAAIGGTLGVLFAPEKGSVTRKKLMEKTDEIKDNLKETVKEKYNKVINKAK